jgi:hypothetical protein
LLQHWPESVLIHALLPPWLGYPFAAHKQDANLRPARRWANKLRCNNDQEHASKHYVEAASEHYLQATLGEADG